MNDASKAEAAYFDGLIAEQGEFNHFTPRGWRTLARRFAQWIDIPRPFDVLDIGCGTGQSREIYIPHCRSFTGVDLSESAIAMARRKFPESQWYVANATALPFPEASFDVVAFSSVLHHIPDFRSALHEAMRILRPGGQVFAFDPNLLHPAMALFRWPKSPFYSSNGVSPNESPLMPGRLRRDFQQAGFVDLHQRAQADLPYRSVAPKLLNACLSLYNSGDWLMARTHLDRFFGSFILTAARKPEAGR
ncbi:MAG TPA: class I SAM-dependent methyltransferase [Tepidisphaeraceae bacterium]|jgi:SAM-dependent methyltransferase|nr:class I SAM-dependent methyltransferase [Tepidisphaeraceae bacterium]